MANLRRSLVINFLSSSGATVLQFVVSILLARILSPSEIGVYSMTVVFVNLAHVFRDFGVTFYLQREPDLTPAKIRSATGVLFTTSWIIALALFMASESLGRWFREPGIVPVMRVLAIGFVFIPFGSITSALLARNFEAGKQAYVNAVGTILFCVSCLTLAKLGFGSMSLAWANLINIIACGIAYIPLRPKNLPWMPSFTHWRSVAHFGIGSLLTNCIEAMNISVPDVLLGKLAGAREVGLFSRANSTVTIFTYVAGSTVSYGAVSYLAQAHHRGDPLSPVLARATTLLTGVGWTALALTAVLGKDIVQALYGPTWVDGVPAILPLSIAAAVTMLFHYVPMAVTAIGRPYLSAIPMAVTLVSCVTFGILLFDGSVRNFAWALCLASLATAPIVALQQRRYLHFGAGELLRAVLPSAIVAGVTASAALLADALLPAALPALARLLVMALPLALVWYAMLRLTHHPLVDEIGRLATPVRNRLSALMAKAR
jgi:O-antigen/teichoic acid export membrane protein